MAPFPPTNPYAPPATLPAFEPRTIVPRWFGRAVFAASFWWLFYGVSFVGFGRSDRGEHPDFAASVGVLGLFAALGGWLFYNVGSVVWHFWAWKSIRPEFRNNRWPAGALLLFVPFVSLGWIFVLTRRLERAVHEQVGEDGPRVSGGTRACVLSLVATFIPFLFPVAAYAWLRFSDDVSTALAEASARYNTEMFRE
jgi:hypothetical protein